MQLKRATATATVGVGATVLLAALLGAGTLLAEDEDARARVSQTAESTPTETALPYPDPRRVPVGARLLPNLRSLPAENVHLEFVDGQRRMRFASIIANAGLGPAEVVPDGLLPCPPGQRHASQVLYHDVAGNGRYDLATDVVKTTRPGGCMLDHPEHGHWHFDAMARYTLTRPGERSPLVASDKVSFCLRDNRVTPTASPVRLPQFYGDCSRDRVQGITPGWADVYSADLADQHLDLPADLPDGIYCLHNQADPRELLLEAADDDNASVVTVRITATSAALDPADGCS
ncbi:MAG TPA: lysyl oxidase family protein [Jiangellaceae bacterium]|nr:lysyl oxidase family protein [Jiangellaceae bacterium]